MKMGSVFLPAPLPPWHLLSGGPSVFLWLMSLGMAGGSVALAWWPEPARKEQAWPGAVWSAGERREDFTGGPVDSPGQDGRGTERAG